MDINADFSVRTAVHAADLPWTPSPIPGVERRMLDRIGDEVARATSIVRYAPGSSFAPHVHDGGEEFLVLDGVFQDEHGDFPAGTYVRNPPTSSHRPGSAAGCVIFVKLWQFDPDDRHHLRLNAYAAPPEADRHHPGVTVMPLYRDERETVTLERWAPDAKIVIPAPRGLEILVLSGAFLEGGESFRPQSWLRLPAAALLTAQAGPAGCLVWKKSGHLMGAISGPQVSR